MVHLSGTKSILVLAGGYKFPLPQGEKQGNRFKTSGFKTSSHSSKLTPTFVGPSKCLKTTMKNKEKHT